MRNCKASLTLAALLAAAPVHALQIDAVSVTGADPVRFSVTFNAPPDLVTVDEYGRPRDQFAFWISTNLAVHPQAVWTLVLRSGDAPGAVVAWSGYSDEHYPDSLAALPLTLSGRTVSFAAPISLIGDPQFRWSLLVTLYGVSTDERNGYGGLRDAAPMVAEATPARRTSWGRLKALYAGR